MVIHSHWPFTFKWRRSQITRIALMTHDHLHWSFSGESSAYDGKA